MTSSVNASDSPRLPDEPAVPGFTSGLLPEGRKLYLWGQPSGVNPVLTLGNDLRNPVGTVRMASELLLESHGELRHVQGVEVEILVDPRLRHDVLRLDPTRDQMRLDLLEDHQ